MILESITIAPGGSFGWHTHGAPVAVVVTGGTLTVFDPTVNTARRSRSRREQSFVEPANHVHLARNDGKKPRHGLRDLPRRPEAHRTRTRVRRSLLAATPERFVLGKELDVREEGLHVQALSRLTRRASVEFMKVHVSGARMKLDRPAGAPVEL